MPIPVLYEGHRCTTEVERIALAIADHFDASRVHEFLRITQRHTQGRHDGLRMCDQAACDRIQILRRSIRFIALQVDHHGVIRPSLCFHHFCDAICATLVVRPRQAHIRPDRLAGSRNAVVICRDHDLLRRTARRRPPNPFDQRFSGNVSQRFAGQAR